MVLPDLLTYGQVKATTGPEKRSQKIPKPLVNARFINGIARRTYFWIGFSLGALRSAANPLVPAIEDRALVLSIREQEPLVFISESRKLVVAI